MFGGRTAIVVALALTPLFVVYAAFATLRRGRVSLLGAAALTAALPLLALARAGRARRSGLADPLLMRFVDDNGSAATRVIMFDMLAPFSWPQLLVGPDIEQVESLRRHLGLEQGVENPFIRMTLYQGGFVMAVVFVSLVWFFRELLRGRGLRVIGPVVAMAVLLNASESISVKTNFLDKLVLIFVCMFPLLARRLSGALSPSAASMAGSSVAVALVHQAHAVEQAPERPGKAERLRALAHVPDIARPIRRRARRNSARPCAARRTRRAAPGRWRARGASPRRRRRRDSRR